MAKKLRRFKLKNLPKLTRQQVQITNALLWSLPATPFEANFKERLRETLEPLVHADVDVWFERAQAVAAGGLPRLLAEPTCAAIVGLHPRNEKALLEVDLAIAQMAIDKILGGNAEDADQQRPLSEIEDGVFSFVLLKVLNLLQSDVANEHSIGLKLEGVHGRLADLKERFDVDGSFIVLSFKLFFDTKVGFLRLYLPETLVKEVFPPTPPSEGPAQDRAMARLKQRVDLVRTFSAPLSVEVGRISFSMADLEALEVEDIILVEDTEVRMEPPAEEDAPGVLSGRVTARVGGGHHGTLQGTLQVSEGGRYEVAIEGISPVGEPPARAHLFRGGTEEVAAGGDEGEA